MSGRAARSEYWYFLLFTLLLSFVAVFGDVLIYGVGYLDSDSVGALEAIVSIGTFIPLLTVSVRRLHDTGRPGYYILAPLLFGALGIAAGALLGPLLGILASVVAGSIIIVGFALQIWWFVQKSEEHANRYGPEPSNSSSQPQEVPQ